jgi:hypothetical protein
MAWFEELCQNGHVKDQGQPLEPAGKVVRGKQKTVTDGPFAEAKDVIGRFTLNEARDLVKGGRLSRAAPSSRLKVRLKCGP